MSPEPQRWAMPLQRFALILIILLGAALRLYNLGGASLWWDEANTMNYSRWALDPATAFDSTYICEAPLIAFLAATWNALINATVSIPLTDPLRDFLLRLLPCLVGIATLPLLYILTRRLTANPTAALFATLLFAVSPFQVHYAQELRVYTIHVFTGLVSIYCMLRALDGGRWPWWLGMAIANTLLIYGHYTSFWLVFFFNVYYLTRLPSAFPHIFRWTGWNALMMILIIPALYHAWHCNQHFLRIEYDWYPPLTARTLYITFKNLTYGYGPQAWAYQPLLALAIALALLGAWSLRNRWQTLALLLLLIPGPVLLNFFMWRMRDFSLYEDRIFALSAALACIPIGAGIAWLRPPWLRGMAIATFLALTLPGLSAYYRGDLHPQMEHRIAICDKVDFRAATAYLNTVWQPGDFLAHESNFTTFPMQHYFQHEQAHLGATPEDAVIYGKAFGNPEVLEHLHALPLLAEEAVKPAKRIWYIEAFGVIADGDPQTQSIREWLQQRYPVIEQHEFDGLRLYLFDKTGEGNPDA